jgi:hypothetical protein
MNSTFEAEPMALACILEQPSLLSGADPCWWQEFRCIRAIAALRSLPDHARLEPWQAQGEVAKALGASEAGWLAETLQRLPTVESWPHWRGILVDAHNARAETGIAARLGTGCPEARATAVRELEALTSGGAGGLTRAAGDLVPDVIDALENGPADGISGLRTGLETVDRHLGGLQPGRLYVIGARTGVGKTALALQMAVHAAKAVPVLFVSLEMPAREITLRAIQTLSGVNADLIRRRQVTDRDLASFGRAAGTLRKLPFRISDTGGALAMIEETITTEARERKIGLAVVDYLQLVRVPASRENRATEVGQISSALKRLALRLGIPILAPAQVNRSPVKDGRAPGLADLRDSGAIEQDADAVLLLNAKDDPAGDALEVDLRIAKNRSGPVGRLQLVFKRSVTTFREAAKIHPADMPKEAA